MACAPYYLREILRCAGMIKNRQSNQVLKHQNLMRGKAFRYNRRAFV